METITKEELLRLVVNLFAGTSHVETNWRPSISKKMTKFVGRNNGKIVDSISQFDWQLQESEEAAV